MGLGKPKSKRSSLSCFALATGLVLTSCTPKSTPPVSSLPDNIWTDLAQGASAQKLRRWSLAQIECGQCRSHVPSLDSLQAPDSPDLPENSRIPADTFFAVALPALVGPENFRPDLVAAFSIDTSVEPESPQRRRIHCLQTLQAHRPFGSEGLQALWIFDSTAQGWRLSEFMTIP